MKCNCCPALLDCSNEDVGYETACWYGDSYQDENCIEYKDGSCGCNKTREEIEADMKKANDYLASEECRAEQEREAQLMELFMQNYDFERGDVIY